MSPVTIRDVYTTSLTRVTAVAASVAFQGVSNDATTHTTHTLVATEQADSSHGLADVAGPTAVPSREHQVVHGYGAGGR